jgi:Domain of unknown function (DUF5666)
MNIRLAAFLLLAFSLSVAASAQDPDPGSGVPSSSGQASGQSSSGQGGGYGRRGGMGGMGRGLSGTVTEVAPDHYMVKSFSGDTYTVHFDANTRILKQVAGTRGGGQAEGEGGGQESGQEQGQERGQGRRFRGNPPQPIQASDIKVGDAISSMGDVDASAKTVSARAIVLMDPERARQMQEMEANYGKTWLMGKVTAIDGVKITLTGSMDNAPHSIVADENTTFRRRRDPITLADIQIGDMVRAEGAVKDGVFTATTVGDMGAMQARVPRGEGAPPASPQ